MRKHFVEIQIKNNPFVSATPTTKVAYLLEKNEHLIRMRLHAKASEVPYCDCFSVEEEVIISMPQGCSHSSIFRATLQIKWHKSTLMKSII